MSRPGDPGAEILTSTPEGVPSFAHFRTAASKAFLDGSGRMSPIGLPASGPDVESRAAAAVTFAYRIVPVGSSAKQR
jgi:hypothetical protein